MHSKKRIIGNIFPDPGKASLLAGWRMCKKKIAEWFHVDILGRIGLCIPAAMP